MKIPEFKKDTFASILVSAFCIITLLAFFFIFFGSPSDIQMGARGPDREIYQDGLNAGVYRALLIGIDTYQDRRLPKLDSARNDAETLAKILAYRYDFDVELLIDEEATAARINEALLRLADYKSSNESTLIYFSGLGKNDKENGKGYWLPFDAVKKDVTTYLDHHDLRNRISRMDTLHILLVSDAAYPEALLGDRKGISKLIEDNNYREHYKSKSRWAMISGSEQPVEDLKGSGHSVFGQQLISILEMNKKPYLDVQEIFEDISPELKRVAGQKPLCEPMRNTGDDEGGFIFRLSDNASDYFSEGIIGSSLLAVNTNVIGAKVYLDGMLVGRTRYIPDPLASTEQVNEVEKTEASKKDDQQSSSEKKKLKPSPEKKDSNTSFNRAENEPAPQEPPHLIRTSAGVHQILIEKEGYMPYQTEVDLEKDRKKSVYVVMQLETPLQATLSINTNVKDAAIKFLNDRSDFFQGMSLPPGRYHLEVSANGFEPFRQWIILAPREDKEIDIQLTKMMTLPPVHTVEVTDVPEKNSLGMKFIYIAPDTFEMGSPMNESGRYRSEAAHPVTLTKGYYIGQTEVTVGQWRRFAEASGYQTEPEKTNVTIAENEKKGAGNGMELPQMEDRMTIPRVNYWDDPGFEQTDDHPVTYVSYKDALAFIDWLNKTDDWNYFLPTEAQWEYACRAHSSSVRFWGDDPDQACAFANVADDTAKEAWTRVIGHNCNDGYVYTAPVVSFTPNDFKLYNMLGNVSEWCQDYYGYFSYEALTDPVGPLWNFGRVYRGGSFKSAPRDVRSAARRKLWPSRRANDLGFRLVMEF